MTAPRRAGPTFAERHPRLVLFLIIVGVVFVYTLLTTGPILLGRLIAQWMFS